MVGYDGTFYDTIRPGVMASATVVVPMLMAEFNPGTVIDVGCGEGWWLAEFAEHGCPTVGVDGPYVFPAAGRHVHVVADLEAPLPADLYGEGENGPPFDLALSLEVAEHLSPGRAASFVADLCRLAPVVVFSAAIPGQGGVAHVNECPPWMWAELFAANGFAVSGALRWRLWDNDKVENWYRQNLMVAAAEPDRWPSIFDTAMAPPWHVVHPVLFDARRPR